MARKSYINKDLCGMAADPWRPLLMISKRACRDKPESEWDDLNDDPDTQDEMAAATELWPASNELSRP